jgi:hypothetical protein
MFEILVFGWYLDMDVLLEETRKHQLEANIEIYIVQLDGDRLVLPDISVRKQNLPGSFDIYIARRRPAP